MQVATKSGQVVAWLVSVPVNAFLVYCVWNREKETLGHTKGEADWGPVLSAWFIIEIGHLLNWQSRSGLLSAWSG